MAFTNPTGEAIYGGNVYEIDSTLLATKIFPLNAQIVPFSVGVSWNGLVVPTDEYMVRNNTVILDSDFPLTIGDKIYIDFSIGE